MVTSAVTQDGVRGSESVTVHFNVITACAVWSSVPAIEDPPVAKLFKSQTEGVERDCV